MALEETIETLTKSVDKLTAVFMSPELQAVLKAAAPKAGAAPAPAAGKPAAAPAKAAPKKAEAPKFTADQVKAAVLEVKAAFGSEAAQEIISEHSNGGKLADLMNMPAAFADTMASCKAKMAEQTGGDDPEDPDEGL